MDSINRLNAISIAVSICEEIPMESPAILPKMIFDAVILNNTSNLSGHKKVLIANRIKNVISKKSPNAKILPSKCLKKM
jgi:hypothetical protein